MESEEDNSKKGFLYDFQRLQRDDPSLTEFNFRHFHVWSALEAEAVVQALDQPRIFLKSMTICPQSLEPLLIGLLPHFLRLSPNLTDLSLQEATTRQEGTAVDRGLCDGATDALLVAAAACSSLQKISLAVSMQNIRMITYFLRQTATRELRVDFDLQRFRLPAQRAELVRDGLEQNTRLRVLYLQNASPVLLGWILPGIYEHVSLRELHISVSSQHASAWDAVPELLVESHSIQELHLSITMGFTYNPTQLLKALEENCSLKKIVVNIERTDGEPVELPDEEAHVWRKMLQGNDTLEVLEWRNCTIFADTSDAIANGLAGNTSIKCVSLWECPLFLQDGVSLRNMLQHNETLVKLVLRDCRIGPTEIEYLVSGLLLNETVEKLDLTDNDIAGHGFRSLSDGLQTNKTLQELILANNDIEGPDTPNALRDLLVHNTALKCLDLSDNDVIGYTGGSVVAEGISHNSSLQQLNLRRNRFYSQSAARILGALCRNQTLQALNLNDVALPNADNAILLREILQSSALQSIDLGSNPLDEGDIRMLSQGLRNNSKLRKLHLRGLGLNYQGLLMLGEALTANSTLEHLDIEEDYSYFQQTGTISHRIDEAGTRAFLRLLPRMRGLIFLHGLHIDDEDTASILAESLGPNTVLEQVSRVNLPISSTSKRIIDFYLQANIRGRRLLRARDGVAVPSGLWAPILAKVASPQHIRFMFCLLQHKPDLVQRGTEIA
jgi:Ran GTPase-activating protein (RanGAP) involved in mRNA processing and transport